MSRRRPHRRRLNAFDQCMLAIDDALQRLGNAGFETVTLLWLERPIDVGDLARAVGELGRRHPVLQGRVSRNRLGTRFWDWSDRPGIPVHERSVDAESEDAIQGAAAGLVSRPRDLTADPPLSFHVLHRPSSGDVLLMHASHALLDHGSATRILTELHALLRSDPLPAPAAPFDAIARYRRQYPLRRRMAALLRNVPDYVGDRWNPRGRPRILCGDRKQTPDRTRSVSVRSRRLDPPALDALMQRVRRSAGLPSPSMWILATVFRVFADLVPNPHEDDLFRTGIGVEVERQRPDAFHPQNVSSVLRLEVRRRELADAEALPALLGDRLLQSLKEQRDLGILESNSAFSWSYPLVRRIAGAMVRWAFSFWYAYFEVPDELTGDFGGAALQRLHHVGPAWSPPGVTLLATRFRNELHLTLTSVDGLIDDDQADALLDGVMNGLGTSEDKS